MAQNSPKILRLILGDQLNAAHSWYEKVDSKVTYLLMELRQETDYAPHHIQKVLAFFLAMRRFAEILKAQGHQVIYLSLDAPENTGKLSENLALLIEREAFSHFEYELPDEYRLNEELKTFCQKQSLTTASADTEHFMTARADLAEFFKGKKTYLMERFYRWMRQRYDILMEGDEPLTGRWNYDAENRKKYNPKIPVPQPPKFAHDARPIAEMLQKCGVKTIGRAKPEAIDYPIDAEEARQWLRFFVEKCLPFFGTFQDAMEPNQPFLFHSRLSFALNTKMISPREVIDAVIDAWQAAPKRIDYAQVEGFVRQIIGWREYMRGVYWAQMPAYAEQNYFEQSRKLPDFYWTGKTRMHCLSQAIGQSLEYAYAHHIQRLMITGNFALLAGVHPDEVDAWYLGVYIDAIEWVEITNTRGMSQFADGGLLASKPYISSANYIDKMSRYCGKCHYDKKQKYGDKACPFNSLYWNFYESHRDKLEKNHRVGMMYRVWDKMPETERVKILQQAKDYLENIENI